jgi:hypothetical protein
MIGKIANNKIIYSQRANTNIMELYISPKGYKDKEGKQVTKWFI